MKTYILIFGLFICQFAIGQIDKTSLRGDWIAVEYRLNDTIDNEILYGLILSFNEQGLEYFSLWDDSTIFIKYNELDSLESASNSTFFQFANSDSLIIGDSSSSILYYPMKNSKSEISKEEFDKLLIDKTWELGDTAFTNIKFVNYLPTDFLPKQLGTYYVSDKNGFFQYVGYWTTFNYKKNLFFAFSLNDNFNLYHIIRTEEENVEYDCYATNQIRTFNFKSEKSLNKTEYLKLKKIIYSNTWKSTEKNPDMENYDDITWGLYHIVDSTKVEIIPNILKRSENYPDYINYFVINTSFQFHKNGNYKIFEREKVYDEGKWKLSKDGFYIILNPNTQNEFYLRILEATESEMIIGQTLALIFDEKDSEREIINFRVKLKN